MGLTRFPHPSHLCSSPPTEGTQSVSQLCSPCSPCHHGCNSSMKHCPCLFLPQPINMQQHPLAGAGHYAGDGRQVLAMSRTTSGGSYLRPRPCRTLAAQRPSAGALRKAAIAVAEFHPSVVAEGEQAGNCHLLLQPLFPWQGNCC